MQEYDFNENLIPDYQNLYEKNLACNFSAMEVYRKRELLKYNIIIVISIFVTLFVLALVFLPQLREEVLTLMGITNEALIKSLGFYPLLLFIIFMILLNLDKSYRRTIKKHCLNSFLQKIANISRVEVCPSEVISLIKSTIKNSPRFHDVASEIHCDDMFLGEYNGTRFHLVEAIISRPFKMEEKHRVFYRGIILQIKPNFPIAGTLHCASKYWSKSDIGIALVMLVMAIVAIVISIVEQSLVLGIMTLVLFCIIGYIVWENSKLLMMKKSANWREDFTITSNSTEECNLFLTPRLFKLLADVQAIYKTPAVDCFINPDAISIFIKTEDDKFEFGTVKETLLSPDCGKELYNQLNIILRLVKYFSGRSN